MKKMAGLNVLSLFDGMSCGRLALERAGIPVNRYYSSEVDKYAIAIADDNWEEDTPYRLGDVQKVRGKDLPKIDLLIGGSPCQGFSFAGKQLAFNDPRSKLFFEYVRLLKELNPKYFLLENVRMKKEYLDIISGYLGVQPVQINSKLVSGQNRVRYYWTNIPGVGQPVDKNILLKDVIESGEVNRDKAFCIITRVAGATAKRYIEKNSHQIVFNDFTKPYKEYKCTKEVIKKLDLKNSPINVTNAVSWRKMSPIECERLQTVPDNYTDAVSNSRRYIALGNGWTVDVIAHIFKNIA